MSICYKQRFCTYKIEIKCNNNIKQGKGHKLWLIYKFNLQIKLQSHQPHIEKIYLYAKDSYEGKYQLFVKKCEGLGLKCYNDSKSFIKYSNIMDDICEDIEEYNLNKESKIVFILDEMTADLLDNK